LEWLEISVTTDGEAAEAVVELLNRYCRGGAAVEIPVDCYEHELAAILPDAIAPPASTVVVRAYLPIDGSEHELRRRIEEGLWHLAQVYGMSAGAAAGAAHIPEPVFRTLAEEDWADAWKRQYHVQRIGQRIAIVPAWEEYTPTPDQVVIRLEPGMAFGTGLHPTTRLCLKALEEHLVPGRDVLDVGTGSGILAIAAARLGACSVLALDADLSAVRVARENVAMNDVSGQVEVRHGTLPGSQEVPSYYLAGEPLEMLTNGGFDLVLVNILAPVIISLAPALAGRLTPAGRLIASGLIETQEEEVDGALQAEGLQVLERMQEKDWIALVAQLR
jgi:ribosomal protein L11 methyltransferase